MRIGISFVFCTASPMHLREFASSLAVLPSLMPTVKMELVIVAPSTPDLERASSETRANLAAHDISVRHVETRWGNRNTSRNQGHQAAVGDWVYFVDQDVRIPADRLDVFAARLESLGRLADHEWMLTGPYLDAPECSYWGRSYNWLANLWLTNATEGLRVIAGNVLLKRRQLSAPFSEALLSGGEEIELCRRVSTAGGLARYDADLALVHKADHSLGHFWRRALTHARAKRKLDPKMANTRLQGPLLKAVGGFPRGWPAIAVVALASGWSRIREEA